MAEDKNSNLPVFPTFIFLSPHHQTEIDALTKNQLPYSDYNFISLWSYDYQNRLKLSVLNDNLVVRFQDYLEPDKHFYSFFGSNKTDETIRTLLKYSHSEGVDKLRLIPEFVIKNIQQASLYSIVEDRDSFDYIIAVKDMLEPSSHKRWSMNQLTKKYKANLTVRELDIKDARARQEMLAVVKTWHRQKKDKNSLADNELPAVRKMLEKHNEVKTDKLHVVGIYIDDRLKAFSIAEILDDGHAVGHYKKSDHSYRGLGILLEHHTANDLSKKGVKYLNHEQDLGIEGLRLSKLSSKQFFFLKKYTIGLFI